MIIKWQYLLGLLAGIGIMVLAVTYTTLAVWPNVVVGIFGLWVFARSLRRILGG